MKARSIHLRELDFCDAEAMLAWLHEPAVRRYLEGGKESISLAEVEQFILSSRITEGDLHWAVADEKDVFLGMVSLKNIDFTRGQAEFSIGLCASAQGQGYASKAADGLLHHVFCALGLDRIYMYTRPENGATCAFNLRYGFIPLSVLPEGVARHAKGDFCWYGMTRAEFFLKRWRGKEKNQ